MSNKVETSSREQASRVREPSPRESRFDLKHAPSTSSSSEDQENGQGPSTKAGSHAAESEDSDTTETQLAAPALRLPRPLWVCLYFISAAIFLYGLYVTKAITFPIVLAFLIALPLRSVMRMLRMMKLPNPISAFLVCVVVGGVVLGGVAMLWQPAQHWLENSKSNLAEVERKFRDIRGPLADVQEASESVEKLTGDSKDPETLQVEIKQPSLTNFVMSTTGSVLVGGTITVSLVFLLLAFGEGLLHGVVHSLPTRIDRQKALNITRQAEQTISQYLFTYTLINVGLGVVIGTGMWIIGMPNPVLWGVMAACLNYIPFLGLAVGTGVVFLVALVSFDSMQYALLAPAIYLGANGLEANVITPLLLGRSLKLNVIIIFLFIVVWGWMWGVGGALIAVPLLIVAKVVCDHVERLQPVARLLAA